MNASGSTVSRFSYCTGSFVLWFTIAAVQSSYAAADSDDSPLEAIRQASVASSENLRSAVGVGTFEQHVQEPADQEPKLRTKARVKVCFDQGKYHLRFDYETMLVKTVYKDMEGNTTEEKLVEWKPDRLFAIRDATSVNVVRFSDRIKPKGCEGEVYADLGLLPTGLPWRDPVRLGKEAMDVEKVVQNIGKDSIQITKLGEGGFRGTYRLKNSNKVRVEFDADPKVQFNVVAVRSFNEGDELPSSATELTWKKSGDVWHVEAIKQDRRSLKEPGSLTRTAFKFDSLEVNGKVDPSLFALEATEVPKGTRFLDHRANAPNRTLYYNGSALTPQRP